MNVTVVAVVCSLLGQSPVCEERIVTSSAMDPSVDFMSCMVNAQAGIAQWKQSHPVYRQERFYVEKYKCVPGLDYQPKNDI